MEKLNKTQYLKKVVKKHKHLKHYTSLCVLMKKIPENVMIEVRMGFEKILQRQNNTTLDFLINGEGISFKDNETPLIGVATIKS
jgi:hypothetical protein